MASSSSSTAPPCPALFVAIGASVLLREAHYQENPAKQHEQLHALTILVQHVVQGSFKALTRARYTAFDSNPADGGCQLRAHFVNQCTRSTLLSKELGLLAKQMMHTHKTLNKRYSDFRYDKKCVGSAQADFHHHFDVLLPSKEIALLLQSFILKTLRIPYETLPSGIVMTRTEPSRLSLLSPSLTRHFSSAARATFIGDCQAITSEASLLMIREEAARVTGMDERTKSHLCAMLAPDMVRRPAIKGFAPKAFGLLFYEIKAIFARCKAEGVTIAVRALASNGTTTHLLSADSAHEYALLDSESTAKLDDKHPLFVIDGVCKEPASFVEILKLLPLTTLILGCAAQEAPYNPGSTLSDVTDPHARAEISLFAKHGALTHFQPDHMYCAALNEIVARPKKAKEERKEAPI